MELNFTPLRTSKNYNINSIKLDEASIKNANLDKNIENNAKNKQTIACPLIKADKISSISLIFVLISSAFLTGISCFIFSTISFQSNNK